MFDTDESGGIHPPKLCQNCNHDEARHEIIEGSYYKCTICSRLCSGKFYQHEPGE